MFSLSDCEWSYPKNWSLESENLPLYLKIYDLNTLQPYYISTKGEVYDKQVNDKAGAF